MKKGIFIFVIVAFLAIGLFLIFAQEESEQDRLRRVLMDKWEGIAKKNEGVIDRPVVKMELDKLEDEDVETLDTFTEKISEAKSAVDYLALAGEMVAVKDVLKKTKLENIIQGLFPKIFN